MQYVKAVKICKPKYFIYENNHSIHKNIKMSISEKLGVEFIMIDSALLSAQRRQRCYWTNIPNIIQPINKNILLKDILEENIKGYNYNINSTVIWSKYNQSISKDKSYTLETSSQNLSSIMDQTVITPIREGYFNKGGQGNRIYSIKGKSVCLMTRKSGMGIYKVDLPNGDYDIRKLTPI